MVSLVFVFVSFTRTPTAHFVAVFVLFVNRCLRPGVTVSHVGVASFALLHASTVKLFSAPRKRTEIRIFSAMASVSMASRCTLIIVMLREKVTTRVALFPALSVTVIVMLCSPAASAANCAAVRPKV